MPRVSVIIPSYNRADLLAETLDSLITQTYPDWEALVVDDGYQDNSLELAQKYAAKDNRIRAWLRRGEKKGHAFAVIEGFPWLPASTSSSSIRTICYRIHVWNIE